MIIYIKFYGQDINKRKLVKKPSLDVFAGMYINILFIFLSTAGLV